MLFENDDNKRAIRTYEKNRYTIDHLCKEYYNKALDDFKKHLLDICKDYNSVYDSQIICIAEQLKK